LPKAIDAMRKREQEIQKAILHLSERTEDFTNPNLIMIGGYALRAFVPLSRFTRDCDFALRKKNGWNIDDLKTALPEGYSIEEEEKHDTYGFLRCVKLVHHDKAKVKVSMDFMEGEIRGRKAEEVILIDEVMLEKRKFVAIPIADEPVRIAVPDYLDYFIMKVVSSRASDIRDIASLIRENGAPSRLEERIKQVLPYPNVFNAKIGKRILPEMERPTFIDSWRGIFGTLKYDERDRERVIRLLEKLI